jgi:hypothetical protein
MANEQKVKQRWADRSRGFPGAGRPQPAPTARRVRTGIAHGPDRRAAGDQVPVSVVGRHGRVMARIGRLPGSGPVNRG